MSFRIKAFIFIMGSFFLFCDKPMPKEKNFKKTAEEIKPLLDRTDECYATDMITVEGLRVGWMYREKPNKPNDSGWRFYSGTETQEYVDNPKNTMIYHVNTIANYDPSIIPYLDKPIHSAFERKAGEKTFSPVTDFDFTED